MSTDIEKLSHQRSFQPNIDLLRHLVDEERRYRVDLKQVGLQVGVNEDVQTKEVEVVVEGGGGLLDHLVDVLMATEQGLDHHILDALPERGGVHAVHLPHVLPQLVDGPLVDLAAVRVILWHLSLLVHAEVCQMDEHVVQKLERDSGR